MSFLFVHGAGDPNAEDGSFRLLDRLKPALVLPEGKCVVPLLPRPETPDGRVWTDEIVSALSALDDGATVLAHSFGGSCTLAALSAMPMELRIARLTLWQFPIGESIRTGQALRSALNLTTQLGWRRLIQSILYIRGMMTSFRPRTLATTWMNFQLQKVIYSPGLDTHSSRATLTFSNT